MVHEKDKKRRFTAGICGQARFLPDYTQGKSISAQLFSIAQTGRVF